MTWRCRLLTARPSQDGRVIAEHPTHLLISTQVKAVRAIKDIRQDVEAAVRMHREALHINVWQPRGLPKGSERPLEFVVQHLDELCGSTTETTKAFRRLVAAQRSPDQFLDECAAVYAAMAASCVETNQGVGCTR